MEVVADAPGALGDYFQLLQAAKQRETLPVGDELQQLFAAGAVRVLELKAAHRHLCESTDALREATADAKSQLDQGSLQLQNLLYEKHHYEKEIRSCKAFRSAYSEEQVELVPLQQYQAVQQQRTQQQQQQQQQAKKQQPPAPEEGGGEAAAEGAEAAAAGMPSPEEEGHTLMLGRLAHELASRQADLKQLEGLKQRRDALAADVAQKRSTLSSLEGEVAKMLATAHSVQRQFGIGGAAGQQLKGARPGSAGQQAAAADTEMEEGEQAA